MNRMNRSVAKPMREGPFGLALPPPHGSDSRTLWKEWLVETVLPMVMLLSMSAMTVAMIVLIVTTVAHAGWLDKGTYVSVDPWVTLEPGPAVLREDDIMYPDTVTGRGPQQSDPSFDPDAGYFAAEIQQ